MSDGAQVEPSARVHIDRAWLQASDELVIRESTSAESIAAFVIKVRPTDDGKLAGAIEAIVAQVRAELGAVRKARPDEEPYALLVCREYYMKWRGRESATSRPKGRYGLFLVRGCVRCKSDKTVAVFRVHAYAFKNGARSASGTCTTPRKAAPDTSAKKSTTKPSRGSAIAASTSTAPFTGTKQLRC